MIAVIAGATGLVGSLLLPKLLADTSITQVISVSRKRIENSHPKLNQILISDLSELPGRADVLKGDLYFCCLGTTIKDAGTKGNFRKVDYDAPVAFGRVAKANDARSFTLVSAMGANARSVVFYSRVKGECEEALKRLNLRRLVIFRPGLLLGHRSVPRRGERLAITLLEKASAILPARLHRRIATPAESLAKRMLAEGKSARTGGEVIRSGEI